MKTLSQRIIDASHSSRLTTADDKDRQLADVAPEMLRELNKVLMTLPCGALRSSIAAVINKATQ